MSAPVWSERRAPGTELADAPLGPVRDERPVVPRGPWYSFRPVQVLIGVAAVALMVVVDWPHPATPSQRAQDLVLLERRVDGLQASCSLGVVASITAYDQIVTGQSSDRATAISLAEQSAIDCRPDGNPQLLELTTTSAPRDLSVHELDDAIARTIDWSFPNGAALCGNLAQLLRPGSHDALLSDARSRLATMSRDAAAAQQLFDAAAAKLGAPPYPFAAMGQASPGSVIG